MCFEMKLFSLANSNASPKAIGPCECVDGYTYAKLRPLLEGIHIVDWPFEFFDVENRCRINYKLEGLNRLSLDVYVLPLVELTLESRKCMCVVDLDFVYDSQQTLQCLA
jgi:hypothetical protein